MRNLALAVMAAMAVSAPATASGVAYPMSVDADGQGANQEAFAYSIREQVKASNTFRFVSSNDPGFRLRINMMDNAEHTQVIYAYTLTFAFKNNSGNLEDIFLYSYPGYCGVDILPSCAGSIVARASKQAEGVVDALSKPTGFAK